MPEDESQAYLARWERFPLAGKNRVHSSVDAWKLYAPFLVRPDAVFLPLWWGSLIFALAAVAAIRIGRQFTLRSALLGMSVVAALLGMVAAL
ncbi:hypothetical protein [Lacipirellula sp.]|uniref:hypothetical protein n=1 Tax=Lacipirellula sp. TaxID=2691419 RepID=UPI003D12B487